MALGGRLLGVESPQVGDVVDVSWALIERPLDSRPRCYRAEHRQRRSAGCPSRPARILSDEKYERWNVNQGSSVAPTGD